MSVNAKLLKLGTCTVVSVKGTLVEAKMCTFTLEYTHLSSTSVTFTLTTVQLPNLALVETKRITVHLDSLEIDTIYLVIFVSLT